MTNEEIQLKLNDHEHEIGSLKHRMTSAENVINEVHSIATSVQLLAQESRATGQKVDNLTNKVEAMESKPREDWNKLKLSAITAVVTAVMSAMVAAVITLL